MAPKAYVIFGLLGPSLDNGKGAARWERWRPTVSLCQHDDLLVSRFELLYQPRFADLATLVVADMAAVSPETTVRLTPLALEDPWDFEEVYGALYAFARAYPFQPEHEEYLVHITTGSHVAQICLFLLTEARYLPPSSSRPRPPSVAALGRLILLIWISRNTTASPPGSGKNSTRPCRS